MANETAQASPTQSQQADAGKQPQQRQGGQQQAQRQGNQPSSQQSNQQSNQTADQQGNQGGSQTSNLPAPTRQARPPAPAPRRDVAASEQAAPDWVFDPHGAIRVGMLRLARNWASEGHVYSAINTYREVLMRYPGTGVAAAAVEDMLELARFLEQRGMYFTALDIFHTMEELA